jgi:hypothetical protein
LVFSDQSSEDVSLSGTLTMNVFFEGHEGVAIDDDSDGLDEVEIEIVQLALAGTSTNGPVEVSLAQDMSSRGFIEEQANFNSGELDLPPFNTPGSARMLVELFVVVEVDGTLLHNNSPVTVQGLIDNKPPACGDELAAGEVSVPLHDESDKVTGNSIKGLVLNRCSS